METPFVSAIVSLNGGGNVQATVKDVSLDTAKSLFGLPVKLVFNESEQRNNSGEPFLTYNFVPA